MNGATSVPKSILRYELDKLEEKSNLNLEVDFYGKHLMNAPRVIVVLEAEYGTHCCKINSVFLH